MGTLPRLERFCSSATASRCMGLAPEIGWTGNWGMAASARDKDFVHQLLDRISKAAGGTPKVMIRNVADFRAKAVLTFNIGESLEGGTGLRCRCGHPRDWRECLVAEDGRSPQAISRRPGRICSPSLAIEHGHPSSLRARSQFWPDA